MVKSGETEIIEAKELFILQDNILAFPMNEAEIHKKK